MRKFSNRKAGESMSNPKPRIVIFIEGGLVQEVFSDIAIDVVILDSDVEGTPEDETMKLKDTEGNEEEYFKQRHLIKRYDPEPKVVEHYVSQVEALALAEGESLLDDLIHDVMSKKASIINNEGRDGQIAFLKSEGWTDDEIKEAMMP